MKALEYVKALSDTFIPGVASWNDGSNNKAYLAGELYCTLNGISIYIAAKDDPTKKELAEDTYHALWPVGPIGKPTELQLCVPILAFNFTKYPNAAKAFVAFMIELRQAPGGLYSRGFGGDTLNTAVYLSRLGIATDYITALGDDSLSDEMIAGWQGEGVGTTKVARLKGRLPGIYMGSLERRLRVIRLLPARQQRTWQ